MEHPAEFGPWNVLSQLGRGGQGVVYKVRRGQDPRDGPLTTLVAAISAVGDFASRGPETWGTWRSRKDFAINDTDRLRDLIDEYLRASGSLELGAAKVLHQVDDASLRQRAHERLAREIEALRRLVHPSIARILDAKSDEGWFVTTFYERGALTKHRELFRGKFEYALRAFRSLVEGVAAMHAANIIHRDIKPENIFVDADGRLVLGDMGIVYFEDDAHTRVSETYENVGSRNWMPLWAAGQRLNDVKPSFDVFSLGKVFWWMLSGRSYLHLWYWDDEENDLEKTFPALEEMRLARPILADSVVEKESACLSSAKELLERVDECLLILSRSGSPPGVTRFCRVCGVGRYVQRINEAAIHQQQNFGLRPTGMSVFRIYVCDHCGHCDLFHFASKDTLPSWWS
jgi:serine/threonine protein kinase